VKKRRMLIGDLPDLYFEQVESVYMECIVALDDVLEKTDVAIFLNVLNSVVPFYLVEAHAHDLKALEEDLDDIADTLKHNLQQMIDSRKLRRTLEGYLE
jgi:heptaprenylglyceryl phosphate synthase